MTFLSVENLCFSRGKKPLVIDASFQLGSSGLISLIGVNGSGKTTLLRLLAHLLIPTNGSIRIDGRLLSDMPLSERSRLISWCPQQSAVPFNYLCSDLLMLGRFNHHRGFPTNADRSKVSQILSDCGIEQLANESFHDLSSGEQRKVLLARTMVSDTPLVLLDEPLSNLDPRAVGETMALLNAYSKTKLVLMSTHHIEHVLRFADEVLVLEKSRLIATGKTADTLTEDLQSKLFG